MGVALIRPGLTLQIRILARVEGAVLVLKYCAEVPYGGPGRDGPKYPRRWHLPCCAVAAAAQALPCTLRGLHGPVQGDSRKWTPPSAERPWDPQAGAGATAPPWRAGSDQWCGCRALKAQAETDGHPDPGVPPAAAPPIEQCRRGPAPSLPEGILGVLLIGPVILMVIIQVLVSWCPSAMAAAVALP